jgi:hypothetical protein
VVRAIVRALEKEPAARFHSAGAFVDALRVAAARAVDPRALATTLQ